MNEEVEKQVETALEKFFTLKKDSGRFIDVSRIPLICQNINLIHENIKELKADVKDMKNESVSQDQFWPVKTIVYGLVGTIMLGVLGAIITLILK